MALNIAVPSIGVVDILGLLEPFHGLESRAILEFGYFRYKTGSLAGDLTCIAYGKSWNSRVQVFIGSC